LCLDILYLKLDHSGIHSSSLHRITVACGGELLFTKGVKSEQKEREREVNPREKLAEA